MERAMHRPRAQGRRLLQLTGWWLRLISGLRRLLLRSPSRHSSYLEVDRFPAKAGAPLQRVHLGCGLKTPPDWVNIDSSLNARLSKYPLLLRALKAVGIVPRTATEGWNPTVVGHDLRKPLPFQNDSASAVYTSHLLEHLYLSEAKRLLNECYRILAPGGVLRVVVPDLEAIVREYNGERVFLYENDGDENCKHDRVLRADRLNERLMFRSPAPSRGLLNAYRFFSGDPYHHKWMFDRESLTEYVRQAGFCNVEPKDVHDSRIPGIEAVEDEWRILHGTGICVEATKPSNDNRE
jgi:SAM-dependent methyltransferase